MIEKIIENWLLQENNVLVSAMLESSSINHINKIYTALLSLAFFFFKPQQIQSCLNSGWYPYCATPPAVPHFWTDEHISEREEQKWTTYIRLRTSSPDFWGEFNFIYVCVLQNWPAARSRKEGRSKSPLQYKYTSIMSLM